MSTLSSRFIGGFIAIALLLGVFGCTAQKSDGTIPITTKSSSARDLYLQARDMQDRLLFQQSRTVLEEAVAKDDNFALGHFALSFAQPTNSGFLHELDRAVELAPGASEGERLMILATKAGVSGDVMEQGELLRNLVAAYPTDARAHMLLGTYYFGQQKYDEAIARYNKSVELDSTFTGPYNMLGYAYRQTGDYKDAEIAFRKYIEVMGKDPNPYDSYAELLMKMGRFEESIRNYRKALEFDPNFPASYIGIASDLTYMGQADQARLELDKMISSAADDGQRRQALGAKANTFVYEGNHENALEMVEAQAELARENNDPGALAQDYTFMGSILVDAGRYADAKEKYTEANTTIQLSKLESKLKENAARFLLYNEARVLAYLGSMDEAKAKLTEFTRQVNELGNQNQIRLAYEVKGLHALLEKDFTAAEAALKMGNMNNAKTLYRLALAYEGLGNLDEARNYAKQAAEFYGLNDFNYCAIHDEAKALLEKLKTAS